MRDASVWWAYCNFVAAGSKPLLRSGLGCPSHHRSFERRSNAAKELGGWLSPLGAVSAHFWHSSPVSRSCHYQRRAICAIAFLERTITSGAASAMHFHHEGFLFHCEGLAPMKENWGELLLCPTSGFGSGKAATQGQWQASDVCSKRLNGPNKAQVTLPSAVIMFSFVFQQLSFHSVVSDVFYGLSYYLSKMKSFSNKWLV